MASSSSIPTKNNLDLIRFFLAGIVFLSHAHDLSGNPSFALLSNYTSSTMAVQCFFIISGFLIFQSYDRSSSNYSYFKKRISRILPAYVSIILISFLFLSVFSSLSIFEYFSHLGTWNYLIFNALFLNFVSPALPGVFMENPVQAVNGALWTLKIEATFYVAVPICVWLFRRIGHVPVLILMYALSIIYSLLMSHLSLSYSSGIFIELSRQLPGQMTYFVSGAAMYYYFSWFQKNHVTSIIIGIILYIFSTFQFELLLRPISLSFLVIGIAFWPYMGRFGKFGDFSYGLYIVHFPILQVLVALGLSQRSPVQFMLIAVGLVLLSSVAMWHLIEKRFLRRSNHYRAEAGPENEDTNLSDHVVRP